MSIIRFFAWFSASSSRQFPYTHTFVVALLPFFVMGKVWIRTPEQEAYLDGEFSAYLTARKKHEVKIWRTKLHDKWEERWPERQVLIDEWKLADDTPFNTAQMAALSEALAARKTVNAFIYHNSVLNGFFSSNYITTFAGAQMQNPYALTTHNPYSLVTFAKWLLPRKVPRNPSRSIQFSKSTVTVTTNRNFKPWLMRS